ncbi:ferredoxin, partial [Candidatus Hydrogenedentota bacterium]
VAEGAPDAGPVSSQLRNWPVQLKLVPPGAPYFNDADLLVAADCVPFACADFHQKFLKGNPVVVGCPKLDDVGHYVEKLKDILVASSIKSITVFHMEVPCCTGIVKIAEAALQQSGKSIPMRDVTIGIDGQVREESDWKS